MVLAACGDLRCMRHAEYLCVRREAAQQTSDNVGGGAADADVGFIENQRRQLRLFRGDDLNRETDPRTFTAGCNARERRSRVLWIRDDVVIDRLETAFVLGVGEDEFQRAAGHAETVEMCC